MERATTAGTTYCVNVKTAPVAVYAVLPHTDPEERELLRTFTEAGQQYFTAQSGKTVLEGGEVGLVTETFNHAPVGNGNGGGSTSPSPLDPTKPLANGKVYTLSVTADADLSALTVEADATAEIWLSYSAGSVTWPSAWVWGADTFIPASSDPAPDFVPLNFYRVQVSNFSGIGVTTVKVLSEIENPQGGFVELTEADFVETSFDETLTTIGFPNGMLSPNRRTSYNSANKIVAFGFVYGATYPLFSGAVGYNYNGSKSVPPPSTGGGTSPIGEIHLTETPRRVELKLSAYRGSTGSTLLGGDFDVVCTSDNWQTWDVLPFSLNEGVYSVRIDKKISKLALRSATGGNYFVRLKTLKLF